MKDACLAGFSLPLTLPIPLSAVTVAYVRCVRAAVHPKPTSEASTFLVPSLNSNVSYSRSRRSKLRVRSWSPSVTRLERRGEGLRFALDSPTRNRWLMQGERGAFVAPPRVTDEELSRPTLLGFFPHGPPSCPARPKRCSLAGHVELGPA